MPRWEEESSPFEPVPAPSPERVVARRRFGCFNCCGLVALGVVLVLLWGVVTVARTGLVTIPVVSGWVFRPAAPSRIVTPTSTTNTEHINLTPGPDQTITAIITEQQLTKLLQQSLAENNQRQWPQVASAQIAVRADAVELFVALEQPSTTILLQTVPVVTPTGQLQLMSKSALLGSLTLPPQIVSLALDRSVNRLLEEQFSTEPVTPVQTTLSEGVLAITFRAKDTARDSVSP